MGIIRKAYDLIGDAFGFSNGGFYRIWANPETDAGIAITPSSSLQIVCALRCATLIAGAAASLPIDVYEIIGESRKPSENHPAQLRLDSEPNLDMTSMDYRSQQWLSFLLWGNAYSLVVRDGDRLIALWPLMPEHMQVKQIEGTKDWVYLYSLPGGRPPIPYTPEEILHTRWFSLDGIHGMSAITQARNALGLHRATERTASRFFKNGAQVNQQLEIPGNIPQKVVDQLRKDFQAEYGGSENAYKIAISHSGSKLSPIAVNPRDSQFLEQREFNDLTICMLFGVPPHMVGLTAKSTSWGSGIAEQKQGFLDFTVAPLLTFFEKSYERCLLAKNESKRYIKHNTKAFLRADIAARYTAYSTAVDKGIMNRNEARALEEMDPYAGGEIYTVQSQMIPVDQVGKLPAAPPPKEIPNV